MASSKTNIKLDRYSDIQTYDYNRVILKDKSSDINESYINADYMHNIYDTSKQAKPEFIATQGPIPATFSHFWRMCWQEEVEYIVMCCGITNQMAPDHGPGSDAYWPQEGEPMKWDDLQVSFVKGHQTNNFYWTREFQMKKGDQTKTVTQYHAVGWPDRQVPKPEFLNEFDELLYKIVKYKEESADPKPVVVHCSAGVGRTGTF
jgi:protein tyrosine phosphatase